MNRIFHHNYLFPGILIFTSTLILCGIIFSKPVITDGENTDFSRQYFLTLAQELAPATNGSATNKKSLINHEMILKAQQLTYNLSKENNTLSVNIAKKQLGSSIIFKAPITSTPDTIQVLHIETGEFIGVPKHQICSFQITWFPETNQKKYQSIPFQLINNSSSYIFIGRKDNFINGSLIFILELPNNNDNEVVYEFNAIDMFAISSKHINEFYPPNINYEGVKPLILNQNNTIKLSPYGIKDSQ